MLWKEALSRECLFRQELWPVHNDSDWRIRAVSNMLVQEEALTVARHVVFPSRLTGSTKIKPCLEQRLGSTWPEKVFSRFDWNGHHHAIGRYKENFFAIGPPCG